MSDQTSIFKTDASTETNELHKEDYSSALDNILNENGEKKYKSVEDALNALNHSQKFIPQLQEENSALKAKLEEIEKERLDLMSIENTLAEMANKQQETGNTNQQTQAPDIDIDAVFEKKLQEYEARKKLEQNKQAVAKSLVDSFGERAQEVFEEKAKELGISPQELEELSMKSPSLVLSAIGVSGTVAHKQTNVSPPSGNVNTSAMGDYKESFVGRNSQAFLSGATSSAIKNELEAAKRMAEEIRENGRGLDFYADPANYFRDFKGN